MMHPGSVGTISGVVGEPPRILRSATFHALTMYGAVIPKAFANKAAALAWAEAEGDKYPRCRIVRLIGTATRTIWKQQADRWAA